MIRTSGAVEMKTGSENQKLSVECNVFKRALCMSSDRTCGFIDPLVIKGAIGLGIGHSSVLPRNSLTAIRACSS